MVLIEKFRPHLEKLYGGKEGVEKLLNAAKAYFTSVGPWLGAGAGNYSPADVSLTVRPKVASDRIFARLQQDSGEARLHTDQSIGTLNGCR